MLKLHSHSHKIIPFLLFSVSAFFYIVIGYFTKRYEHHVLLLSYMFLFGSYIVFMLFKDAYTFKKCIIAAILFRLLLFLAVPGLSDDFYRFIWDGRLWLGGTHPFIYTPTSILSEGIDNELINSDLYASLNSKDYYTVYPPFCQFIFLFSVWLFPDSIMGSILVIRMFIFSADIAAIFLLKKLAGIQGGGEKNVAWYALNPLVIIELTGNLHFEAVMLFFLLLSLYGIQKNKIHISALAMSFAICTKLIPLIFIPLILKKLSLRRALFYCLTIVVATLLIFAPLWSFDLLKGMSSSILLYFQKFEFNASIYYVVREIGYVIKGYNIIGFAGKFLALATLAGILFFVYKVRDKLSLPQAFMWMLLIYLSLTTTLHPWYITPLIALSCLTSLRFVILWSFLIFFTYLSYFQYHVQENLFIVGIEYVAVAFFLGWELWEKRKASLHTF